MCLDQFCTMYYSVYVLRMVHLKPRVCVCVCVLCLCRLIEEV